MALTLEDVINAAAAHEGEADRDAIGEATAALAVAVGRNEAKFLAYLTVMFLTLCSLNDIDPHEAVTIFDIAMSADDAAEEAGDEVEAG